MADRNILGQQQVDTIYDMVVNQKRSHREVASLFDIEDPNVIKLIVQMQTQARLRPVLK